MQTCISPDQFRVWLMRYSGDERPGLNEALTGTLNRPVLLTGGQYSIPGSKIFGQIDLRHVSLEYCTWLAGPLMPGLLAQESIWDSVRIEGADLSGADFTGATMNEVSLAGADLSGAILHRGHFRFGHSHRARFTDAQAIGTEWRDWHFGARDGLSSQESFTDLSGVDFSFSRLEHCSFDRCLLNGTNFYHCIFVDCKFNGILESQGIDFTEATDVNGFSVFPLPQYCVNAFVPAKRFQ